VSLAAEMKPRRRPAVFAPPWRDPAGRFSRLKTITLALCAAPVPFLLWQAETGLLGSRPIHQAMLDTGFWAIRFLVLCLAVTPVRAMFNWPRVVHLRRMLGLTAAFYTVVHVVLYAADEGWSLGFVLEQMLTVFYLILGTLATLGFIALAATSTDRAIFRLGRRWKALHRLIYPIAALSFWHFFLTQKIDIGIALVPAGLLLWVLLWRIAPASWRRSLPMLAVLAIGAVTMTALGEAGWYALNSGIDPSRVLEANFSTARVSPAGFVAIDLALVLGAILLGRALRGRSDA